MLTAVKFQVEEVALEFPSLEDRIMNYVDDNVYPIPCISENILCEFINYCKYRIHPSSSQFVFDARYANQLDPVTVFNLIQAAHNGHNLKIKGLMDLTCLRLVNKVKATKIKDIINEFHSKIEHIDTVKHSKRTHPEVDSLPVAFGGVSKIPLKLERGYTVTKFRDRGKKISYLYHIW